MTSHRLLALLHVTSLLLLAGSTWAAEAVAPPPEAPVLPAHWSLTEDGSGVIDERARLVWARCVVGMEWTGSTCSGQPLWLDYGQAVEAAIARAKTDGLRWRLPQFKELQRLADLPKPGAGLDTSVFPGGPRDWHWSGTANILTGRLNPYNYGNVMQGASGQSTTQLDSLHGWAVNLANGEARGDVTKRSTLYVRLVRPLN